MLRCWCGSMAEQLICNQQVVGSTPITSSKASHQVKPKYKGDFPSGQRGQTVNLLSLTSVVRIHHPPPTKNALLSTKTKVRFLNEARLRRMKNEAGLRLMKCALRHMRMHGRDSLHVCEANASWQRQLVAVAASYCQRQCFIDKRR